MAVSALCPTRRMPSRYLTLHTYLLESKAWPDGR